VAFVWELTKETINLPLSRLQGGLVYAWMRHEEEILPVPQLTHLHRPWYKLLDATSTNPHGLVNSPGPPTVRTVGGPGGQSAFQLTTAEQKGNSLHDFHLKMAKSDPDSGPAFRMVLQIVLQRVRASGGVLPPAA